VSAQIEWLQSSVAEDLSYPAPPWEMVGSLWLTLFRVREPVDDLRPAGVYGAAFVSYDEGSPLTYHELLVGRAVSTAGDGRRVTITDIWVDSPESVAGGRELWAIPKGLCDFELDTSHRGPLSSTEWSASFGRRPIASATFTEMVDLPSPCDGLVMTSVSSFESLAYLIDVTNCRNDSMVSVRTQGSAATPLRMRTSGICASGGSASSSSTSLSSLMLPSR